MNRFPKSRITGIVMQDLGNEALVYDSRTHQAYHLNQTAAIVYHACDGKTSFDELKRRHKFTDDLIHLALYELKQNNLIIDYAKGHFGDLSRREVIRKVGLISLISLPIIKLLVAPAAAQAASGCLAAGQRDCRVTPCCPGLGCEAGAAIGSCFVPPPIPS